MDLTSSYNIPATDITREPFFNIGGPTGFMRWGIYIFVFITVFYIIYTIVQTVRGWRQGKGELRTDYPEKRIYAVLKYVVFQAKVLKERYAGIMHASIFFGFIVLFIVTLTVMAEEDLTALFFHHHFIYGNFYLIMSLIADFFGLIVLLGLGMAIVRRYITKPSRLDTKSTDTFALVLLLLVVITGFTNEAWRIAITGMPAFEKWSFFGYFLALPFSYLPAGALKVMHYISWWVHMIAAFVAAGLICTGKLGHILTSTLNVYFMNLNDLKAETKFTLPLIDPKEFEIAETFGVVNAEEYTWKHLMDSDACTRCGRCQDNCPAYLTEKPLSPKKIINDIKDNMDERIPLLMNSADPSSVSTAPILDGAVQSDEFWSCTNCGACMEACPVAVEHIPKILELRRHKILMVGEMAPELQTSVQNMENNYNPYGFAFAERGDWIPEDLDIKTLSEDQEVDYLYYAGCAASYDERNKKVAIAFLRIMKKAGYKVGILGAEEACCGDSALRAGNEYLAHMLMTQNLEMFKNYNVKRIITTCPHCFNVSKKEYKKFAEIALDSNQQPLEHNFEVYHHTEIIDKLIKNGQIKLKESLNEKVTLHDSCMLGRYNEIYKEPRNAIKAIPGTDFVEMERHHDASFCCGAGVPGCG